METLPKLSKIFSEKRQPRLEDVESGANLTGNETGQTLGSVTGRKHKKECSDMM